VIIMPHSHASLRPRSQAQVDFWNPTRRPIPSIRTLCETYGIARATAGKAVGLLADEGLIRLVPGRGWFVAPKDDWPSSR
jgi:DNA-binding GntR family transcriptional regulator